MGEGRPVPQAADPPRPAPSAIGLSPVQQAYGDWVTHRLGCMPCRDIDTGDCDQGAALWQAYKDRDREAYQGLTS